MEIRRPWLPLSLETCPPSSAPPEHRIEQDSGEQHPKADVLDGLQAPIVTEKSPQKHHRKYQIRNFSCHFHLGVLLLERRGIFPPPDYRLRLRDLRRCFRAFWTLLSPVLARSSNVMALTNVVVRLSRISRRLLSLELNPTIFLLNG